MIMSKLLLCEKFILLKENIYLIGILKFLEIEKKELALKKKENNLK